MRLLSIEIIFLWLRKVAYCGIEQCNRNCRQLCDFLNFLFKTAKFEIVQLQRLSLTYLMNQAQYRKVTFDLTFTPYNKLNQFWNAIQKGGTLSPSFFLVFFVPKLLSDLIKSIYIVVLIAWQDITRWGLFLSLLYQGNTLPEFFYRHDNKFNGYHRVDQNLQKFLLSKMGKRSKY